MVGGNHLYYWNQKKERGKGEKKSVEGKRPRKREYAGLSAERKVVGVPVANKNEYMHTHHKGDKQKKSTSANTEDKRTQEDTTKETIFRSDDKGIS